MKVNHLSDKPSGAITGAGKPVDRSSTSATGKSTATAPTGEAGVTVSLSPVTQNLASGVSRPSTDVFNAQKVQAVRQAIENGTFSINAEAVADKLLSNARDMLSVAAK